MNSQLVKGAALTGKQFQDHGASFNEGYMQGRDPNALANAQYEAKMERRNNETKIDNYMNSLPADFDVSQIPSKYRDKISSFLTAGKQAYADEAMNINDYESGSDEYIAAVAKMNSVKNSFKNLKNQFDMFGANKKEVAESMLEGLYSKGNNTSEMSLLTSVYTDELDMEIGEDGNIGFITEEGVTNFGDLPDYFNKDYTSGDAIMKMSNQVYKAGIPLNPATRMMYENNLYNMIEKGGVATLKSLARDDFFNRGGIPGITDEELNDPMQRDAVEKKVVDHFMGVMNTQANSGVKYKPESSKSNNSDISPKVTKWLNDNEGAELTANDYSNNVFAGTKYYLEPAYASEDEDAEIKGYYIVKEGRRSGEGMQYVPDLKTSTMAPIINKLKI